MNLNELVYEHSKNPEAKYRLKDLKELYLRIGDPLEFSFARVAFDSFEDWALISESPKFAEKIAEWRRELLIKIRSEALMRIIEEAQGDSKNSYSANKFLVEAGWIDKDSLGRGRPLKIVEEVDTEELKTRKAKDDFARLFKVRDTDDQGKRDERVN